MRCGSAVFAGNVADTVGAGVETIGVALTFGLSVVAMAYVLVVAYRAVILTQPLRWEYFFPGV